MFYKFYWEFYNFLFIYLFSIVNYFGIKKLVDFFLICVLVIVRLVIFLCISYVNVRVGFFSFFDCF